MLKKIFIFAIIVLCFFYGLVVGHYRIFPFEQTQTVKNLILNNDSSKSLINSPYYLHKKTFFELNHRDYYDVVFVGDSLTDYSNWNEIFTDQIVANRGISGDTTVGVLNRIDSITNTKAKQAFIMIGTNDITANESIDIIFNNYIKIISKMEDSNITPVVQSTLLTYNQKKTKNKTITQLNEKLEGYCAKNGITYVDLNKYLSSNGQLENQYSYDGLHLNGQGYAVWSKVISKYINN